MMVIDGKKTATSKIMNTRTAITNTKNTLNIKF